MNMKYKPNLNDKRVQQRIRSALGFAVGVFSDTPHEWSTRYIDRYFGNSQHGLSKWLRHHLLITVSARYNKDTGECKSYILNRDGVRYLRDVLTGCRQSYAAWVQADEWRRKSSLRDLVEGDSTDEITGSNPTPSAYPSVTLLEVDDYSLVKEWAKEEFCSEITTLDFIYEEKSNRLWHPMQNIRKPYKKAIFNDIGLNYQYDIDCCAPTLIHQYSQQLEMDLYLFALRRYLRDRKEVRQELATQCSVTEDQAKKIVNALFAGAQLGHNPDSSIYKMLSGNHKSIELLKNNTYIQQLREDIRTCWEYIRPHTYSTTTTDKNGRTKRLPMTSRQKWNIYFQQEQLVMKSVRDFMTLIGNKFFLEHDGWTCSNEIVDIDELRKYILSETGYLISVSMESLVVTPHPVHTLV